MVKRLFLMFVVCPLFAFGFDDAPTGTQKIPPRQELVVVTGAFEPLPLDEADRAVTAFETRNQPLLFPSFIDYLLLEPSVDLRQRASDGIQCDVSIRGATFGQTLVLINGLRANDPQSGHHNLDQPLPMGALERIEVLRGTGSTLYGADAIGGAVNFITAAPAVSEFRTTIAFGNFGINQQSGAAAYSRRRFSEQLTFEREFSTGFMPDRDYRNLQTASNTHLKSGIGHTTLLLAYGDKPFGADQFYGNWNSWERTTGWFAGLSQDLGSKTQVSFGFRRHTDQFVLLRDHPEVYANHHASESWEYALRRHDKLATNATLSYGAEGYRDSIDSNNLGHHARNRGAVYANFDVRALRRFSFSVGAREEAYGSLRTNFNPSASAGYWLSSRLKLRASASRAFRLPTYTELYYSDPATRGNPNLHPESAWSYEVGLDWNSAGVLGGDVTVFHRRERYGIDYMQRSSADPLQYATNVQNLNFTGIETTLRLRLPHSQQVDFAYAGLHGNRDSSFGNLRSRYLFNYLSNNGSIGWQGSLPGKIMARTRLGVTERRGLDPYALWDAALTRTFGRVSPFVQFTNLTDTRYEEITVPAPVPMPGRTVVGGMNFVLRGSASK